MQSANNKSRAQRYSLLLLLMVAPVVLAVTTAHYFQMVRTIPWLSHKLDQVKAMVPAQTMTMVADAKQAWMQTATDSEHLLYLMWLSLLLMVIAVRIKPLKK